MIISLIYEQMSTASGTTPKATPTGLIKPSKVAPKTNIKPVAPVPPPIPVQPVAPPIPPPSTNAENLVWKDMRNKTLPPQAQLAANAANNPLPAKPPTVIQGVKAPQPLNNKINNAGSSKLMEPLSLRKTQTNNAKDSLGSSKSYGPIS